jgi:Uncharacterized protein conserved in bacteria (DUF2199)
VSLSRDSFTRVLSLWTTPGRECEQPYFGWMSTELPMYQPSTPLLKTRVHTRPVGQRPLIELEPTDHPLAVEQRAGITLARLQEIAETLLHALPGPAPTPTPGTGRYLGRARCKAPALRHRSRASPDVQSRDDAHIPAVQSRDATVRGGTFRVRDFPVAHVAATTVSLMSLRT